MGLGKPLANESPAKSGALKPGLVHVPMNPQPSRRPISRAQQQGRAVEKKACMNSLS